MMCVGPQYRINRGLYPVVRYVESRLFRGRPMRTLFTRFYSCRVGREGESPFAHYHTQMGGYDVG